MGVSQKTKIELPYDPATSLPGIYLEKKKKKRLLIQRDACTPMLMAVLFTIAKIWKWPKSLSTDERIKCGVYIFIYHLSIYLSSMYLSLSAHTYWNTTQS